MQKIRYSPVIYPFHIDFMRHVNNSVYVQWMEVMRCQFLDAVGLSVPMIEQLGFGPVLVETHITYKKELRLGDEVHIEMWLSELSGVSAWMEFVFLNGKGELVATGRQRGVFIEIRTGRPRRLTPEDRARCEAYLATNSV
jgi:acyl-CoA thioester hydrolase